MTVLIRIAIGIYVIITVSKLVLKSGDSNFSSTNPIELDKIDGIDFLDSNLKIFHVIEK
jgi:hypothetical protein